MSVLYDIADISNFDTVAVVAFRVESTIPREPQRTMRLEHIEVFCCNRIPEKILAMEKGRVVAGVLLLALNGGAQTPGSDD